jgi:chromosome segregation ATPase
MIAIQSLRDQGNQPVDNSQNGDERLQREQAQWQQERNFLNDKVKTVSGTLDKQAELVHSHEKLINVLREECRQLHQQKESLMEEMCRRQNGLDQKTGEVINGDECLKRQQTEVLAMVDALKQQLTVSENGRKALLQKVNELSQQSAGVIAEEQQALMNKIVELTNANEQMVAKVDELSQVKTQLDDKVTELLQAKGNLEIKTVELNRDKEQLKGMVTGLVQSKEHNLITIAEMAQSKELLMSKISELTMPRIRLKVTLLSWNEIRNSWQLR